MEGRRPRLRSTLTLSNLLDRALTEVIKIIGIQISVTLIIDRRLIHPHLDYYIFMFIDNDAIIRPTDKAQYWTAGRI